MIETFDDLKFFATIGFLTLVGTCLTALVS